MIRMKNRNQSPVNGWQFFQAQTNWDLIKQVPSAQWDFNLAVQSIIAHRKLNPRFKLPTDQLSVENELDYANAKRMQGIQGADGYIQSDEVPIPKVMASRQGLASNLQRLAVGAVAQVEWIRSGEEAVKRESANKRALTCSKCEKNGAGDWLSIFTVPAQNAIRLALEEKTGWNLTTDHDDKLGVCSSCSCPLKLKVHMSIDSIMKKIPKDSFDDLVPNCWIRIESGSVKV